MSLRVIVLGNRNASDDGAALEAADAFALDNVIRAGRPGVALLDLLDGDEPVVLVDVTRSESPPGTLHRLSLSELSSVVLARTGLSSHGFGPTETLRLAAALGRSLPPGQFLGIEGSCFEPGTTLSPSVRAALPALVRAVRETVARLG